uniref:Alternative protein ACACA n=1 Tax=Homo sapiens TaxID=9606 RepID=L8EAV0_HUMAN|nr:alternative protein ACACA [Homo sapiens]
MNVLGQATVLSLNPVVCTQERAPPPLLQEESVRIDWLDFSMVLGCRWALYGWVWSGQPPGVRASARLPWWKVQVFSTFRKGHKVVGDNSQSRKMH